MNKAAESPEIAWRKLLNPWHILCYNGDGYQKIFSTFTIIRFGGIGAGYMTANAMRVLLVVDMVSLALLSIFYLRQRRLSWPAYCFWGLVALLLPVLGPFLVIACRPGQANWFSFSARQPGREQPISRARARRAKRAQGAQRMRSYPWHQL